MSTVHHTNLQIYGPSSGHCSHLVFHPPPEVQQPSPVRWIQPSPFKLSPLTKLSKQCLKLPLTQAIALALYLIHTLTLGRDILLI